MLPTQDQLDEVYEALREIYEVTENELNLYVNLELFNHLDSKDWATSALSTTQLNKVKSFTAKKGKEAFETISKSTFSAFKLIGLQDRNEELEELQKQNKQGIKMLITSANNAYKNGVKSVKREISLKKETKPLFDAMLQQANKGFEKGLSVVYSNNRIVSYKGYMEMLSRTTVTQAITNQQMDLGKETKTVFYIVNSFGDCADDHAELQGKIYYDDRYKSFGYKQEFIDAVDMLISMKNMMSIQDVQKHIRYEKKGKRTIDVGWLTTRPNCRHRFVPITLEQAAGDESEILKKLKLSRGTYKDDKYQHTQELRNAERNIRKYKDQEYLNQQIQKLGYAQGSQQALELANKYKHLVSVWQKEARTLCSKYDYLERDYDRESRKIIVQDLGVKYGVKQQVINPNTPTTPVTPTTPKTPVNSVKFTLEGIKKNYETPKIYDSFENYAVKNDDTTNKILANISKLDKVKTGTGSKKSHYNALEHSIQVFKSDRAGVVFHEVGHSIDHLAAKLFANPEDKDYRWESEVLREEVTKLDKEFKGYIPKEITDICEGLQNKIVEEVKSKIDDSVFSKIRLELGKTKNFYKQSPYTQKLLLNDAMQKEIKKMVKDYSNKNEDIHKWGAVSDIYDAITKGFSYNSNKLLEKHGYSYYEGSILRIASHENGNGEKNLSEIFANYCEIRIGGYKEQMDFLKKNLPSLTKKLDEVYEGIATKLENING